MRSISSPKILMVLTLTMFSCSEKNITDPDQVLDSAPILELVRLEGDLGKSTVSSGSSIDFGEIPATRSQYYLLLNKGARDAFDINFSSDEIIVNPSHINVVPGDGSENIETLPIIEMTATHVIPPFGVGELLPFEIGVISDTILFDYKYLTMAGDTSTIDNEYYVEGSRVGAFVSLTADSVDVINAASWIGGDTNDPQEGFRLLNLEVDNLGVSSLSSFFVVNRGNVDIAIEVWDWEDRMYGRNPLGTHSIAPGDSVDIENYPNISWDETSLLHNYLVVSCGQNILSFANQSYTNGKLGIYLLIRS